MIKRMKRKYWVLVITFIFVLFFDQFTKHLVLQKIPLHHTQKVIEGFFNLTHVRNTGGAFGILGGERGGIGSLLFITTSLIAVSIILFLFYRLKEHERIHAFSLSLILGGAIGNLVDRIRYQEVVDFLDFHLFRYHWPAFNVADSAITIGIALMVFELLIHDRRRSTKQQAPNLK